jgi:hypothetical protein
MLIQGSKKQKLFIKNIFNEFYLFILLLLFIIINYSIGYIFKTIDKHYNTNLCNYLIEFYEGLSPK